MEQGTLIQYLLHQTRLESKAIQPHGSSRCTQRAAFPVNFQLHELSFISQSMMNSKDRTVTVFQSDFGFINPPTLMWWTMFTESCAVFADTLNHIRHHYLKKSWIHKPLKCILHHVCVFNILAAFGVLEELHHQRTVKVTQPSSLHTVNTRRSSPVLYSRTSKYLEISITCIPSPALYYKLAHMQSTSGSAPPSATVQTSTTSPAQLYATHIQLLQAPIRAPVLSHRPNITTHQWEW